jgi:hypothetical protein
MAIAVAAFVAIALRLDRNRALMTFGGAYGVFCCEVGTIRLIAVCALAGWQFLIRGNNVGWAFHAHADQAFA